MKKLLSVICLIAIVACSLMAVSMTASAVDSPSGGTIKFNVSANTYSAGKSQALQYSVDNGTIVLKKSDSTLPFTGWVISGTEGVDYEIVSGTLTSEDLVIRPLSNVNIEESYDVQGSAGYGKPDVTGNVSVNAGKTDSSNSSPATGNAALALVSVIAIGAFSAMVISKKRIAE